MTIYLNRRCSAALALAMFLSFSSHAAIIDVDMASVPTVEFATQQMVLDATAPAAGASISATSAGADLNRYFISGVKPSLSAGGSQPHQAPVMTWNGPGGLNGSGMASSSGSAANAQAIISEPMTFVLLGIGLLSAGVAWRKRKAA